jgi:stage II sporulation protein D
LLLRAIVPVVPVAMLAAWLPAPALSQPAGVLSDAVAVRPVGAPAAANPTLRVLLAEGPQLLVEAPTGGLQLRDGGGEPLARLEPSDRLFLRRDPGSDGDLQWRLNDQGAPRSARELWLEPAGPDAVLGLRELRFRGQLQLLPRGEGVLAINHVALETYLPSVVGSEMPASWPQPALQAQAVAARTYALRQRRPGRLFDLKSTVASQVYRGIDSETDSTREAVWATSGQVLTYQGALIEAVFHSSGGGRTEASGDLWAQQLPYLVPVADFDEHSPVRSWQQRVEPAQLRTQFAEIGGLTGVQVLARSSSGRVLLLRFTGPAGVLLLSGAQLRQRLGLRSTLIELELIDVQGRVSAAGDSSGEVLPVAPPPPLAEEGRQLEAPPLVALLIRGRGFGHGIGMSQWGAYGLARRGAPYTAILSHYYPGTQLDAYRDP